MVQERVQVVRPLLIGMNSPQSTDPADALRVWDLRSSGGRLYSMLAEAASREDGLDLSHDDYHTAFERVNLLNAKSWSKSAARREAPRIYELMLGRVSVICGIATLGALKLLDRHGYCEWNPPGDENRFCVIPHPSGLGREYNDPAMRTRVGDLLYGLYSGRTIAELAASVE